MTELYTSMNRAHMQGMAMKRAKKVVKSRERLEPDEKTGDFRRLAAETEQVTRTWRVYGRWVQNEDCDGVFGLGDPSWVETPGWSSSKYCPLAQESERQLARLQQLGIKYFTQTPDYDCLKEEGGDDSWGQRVHTKGKRMRDVEVLRREGWWGPATAVVAAAQASPPHKLHISMHPLEFLLWLPCHSSIPCPLHLYSSSAGCFFSTLTATVRFCGARCFTARCTVALYPAPRLSSTTPACFERWSALILLPCSSGESRQVRPADGARDCGCDRE